jgi:hypothetical protein
VFVEKGSAAENLCRIGTASKGPMWLISLGGHPGKGCDHQGVKIIYYYIIARDLFNI